MARMLRRNWILGRQTRPHERWDEYRGRAREKREWRNDAADELNSDLTINRWRRRRRHPRSPA